MEFWGLLFLFWRNMLINSTINLTQPNCINLLVIFCLYFFIEKVLHERSWRLFNQSNDWIGRHFGVKMWRNNLRGRTPNDKYWSWQQQICCLFVCWLEKFAREFFFFSFHGPFDGIDFLSVDWVIDLKIPWKSMEMILHEIVYKSTHRWLQRSWVNLKNHNPSYK